VDMLLSLAALALGCYGVWRSFHPDLRRGRGGRGRPASWLDRWLMRLFAGAFSLIALIRVIRLLWV
jgi:hypothetical protein